MIPLLAETAEFEGQQREEQSNTIRVRRRKKSIFYIVSLFLRSFWVCVWFLLKKQKFLLLIRNIWVRNGIMAGKKKKES